jgi:cytoskeletal protein CcmA (bactofilin family)
MSTNIITASNLVVAGNIAVGGFLMQGTSLSDGNVNVGSITISGVQLEVSGTTLNFSGANLTGLTICGAPIGGGWVGEATSDLSMNGLNILNVNRISGSDGILIVDTSQRVIFTNDPNTVNGVVVINLSDSYVGIGSGNTAPTAEGEKLYVTGSTIITGSCAIGTTTLSGALNVGGDVYVSGSVYTASQSIYIGDVKISQSGTTINFESSTLTGLTVCGDSIVTSHPEFATLSATVGGYSTSFTTQQLTISGVPFVADLSTLYIGVGAGVGNTDSDVIAIGNNAAQNNNGHPVIAIGNAAAGDNSGNFVYAVGDFAAAGNQGEFVNAVGYQAGSNNTGYYVDAIGTSVATNNSGTNVVAIGQEACANNTGSAVNAIGHLAGTSNTGSFVNAIGRSAGFSNTGSYCTFIGSNATPGYVNTDDYIFDVYSANTDLSVSFLYGNISTNQVAIGTRTLSGALNVSGDVYVSGSVYTASQSIYVGDVKLSATAANELTISGGLLVTSPFGALQNSIGNVVYASGDGLNPTNPGTDYQVGDVVTFVNDTVTKPFNGGPHQQLIVTEVDGGGVTVLSLSGEAYYSNLEGVFQNVATSNISSGGAGLVISATSVVKGFSTAPTATRQQPLVQNGSNTLVNGSATVYLPFLYGNDFYSVAITPLADNSGFYANPGQRSFTVTAANSTGTETWAFRWATFGKVELD